MAETNTETAKDEIRRARADIDRDFAELDHQLHVDLMETIRENAPAIAAGAAALGAIVGFSGLKGLKALLALGVSAAAAAFIIERVRGGSGPGGTVGVTMR